ncbi:MAG: hypothetical protein ABI790_14860 [Betaproteobacteria bacterium]
MRTRTNNFLQKNWVPRVCVATILAILAGHSAEAFASPGGGTAHVVRFDMPPIAYARNLQNPASITIENRHIAQGYIDLDNATEMLLSANVDGCLMSISLDSAWIARATLRIGGQEHSVNAGRGVLAFASQRASNSPVSIGYRLYLNNQARPGVYPWPLAFTVAPKLA